MAFGLVPEIDALPEEARGGGGVVREGGGQPLEMGAAKLDEANREALGRGSLGQIEHEVCHL